MQFILYEERKKMWMDVYISGEEKIVKSDENVNYFMSIQI